MRKDSHKIIIQLLAVTMITIIFWIGFEIYYLSAKKDQTDVPQEMLAPIDPVLNQEILTGLPERISPTQEELNQIPEERKDKFESQPASPSSQPASQ